MLQVYAAGGDLSPVVPGAAGAGAGSSRQRKDCSPISQVENRGTERLRDVSRVTQGVSSIKPLATDLPGRVVEL